MHGVILKHKCKVVGIVAGIEGWSAKVPAEHEGLGTIFEGILDGWQGSINACCVHDGVGSCLS